MKYYKISTWSPYITQVEVEKETDKFVYINGRREARRTEWGSGYAPTWDAAVNQMQQHLQNELDQALKQAEYRQDKLDEFREEIASQS